MSTVSPSRMLKLPALPTARPSSIRREPWLTSCSRPARSSPGSTPRTPQDGRTRLTAWAGGAATATLRPCQETPRQAPYRTATARCHPREGGTRLGWPDPGGTRSGWRDRRGGEREYGRVRGKAAQARNIRIEFARREPAELDRPPHVVARVSVELVPVRDQDHVALSWTAGSSPSAALTTCAQVRICRG